jgi:two-component system NtrC family response regulator
MRNQKILFVDDDKAGRQIALYNLKEEGYEVDEAQSGEQALEVFDAQSHSLVITDIRMPGISGIDLLREIKNRSSDVPVLVITAYASINTAVEAMKLGADDFIIKPFNRDQLVLAVSKAVEHRSLKEENRVLKVKLSGIERPAVYCSEAMAEVFSVADRVAGSDVPVLITGESGTGKELIARRTHMMSSRAASPFIAINCAAIPSELIESELFGHTKGAFTGATKERLGRFRQANGGTIFLDEIGDLPEALQAKLLRILQEGVVDVVGSDSAVDVNVRVVSATNKDLEVRVREGRFRDDLYYRLNVVNIHVPPLRDRSDDIPLLIEHFVRLYSDGRELSIGNEVAERLSGYPWPGNVRELENVCQRLVLLCEGTELSSEDLPPHLFHSPELVKPQQASIAVEHMELPSQGLSLLDLEKNIIAQVLEAKKWNVSKSAVYLGVPRHVLAYRMEKYGIQKK